MSVASNLAEGDERGMDKDSVRFFFMAKGSLAELRTQIQIAYKVAQMEKSTYEDRDSMRGLRKDDWQFDSDPAPCPSPLASRLTPTGC